MVEIIPTGHEVILGEGQIVELVSFEVQIGEKDEERYKVEYLPKF